MKVDLWITILLAIPLAIVANLLTPRLKSWLDSKAEKSKRIKTQAELKDRASRAQILRDKLEQVTKFHQDRGEHQSYILVQLLKIALYGALGGVYGGVLMMFQTFEIEIFYRISLIGGAAVGLVTSMLIFVTSMSAIRMGKNVRDYQSFKNEIENAIALLVNKNEQEAPSNGG